MIETSFNITGAKDVVKGLQKLPREVGAKIVRTGTKTGAKKLVEAYARNLPVRWGLARESATASIAENNESSISYYVGAKKPAYYIQFLEFGADPGPDARHDLEEAFNSQAKAAIEAVKDDMAKKLQAALKRHFKGGRRR
jgi:HK97 gp10 family phage protein